MNDPDDAGVWQQMLAVKTLILKNMDSYPTAIRVCAVQFVERVVQTQTPVSADPRVRRFRCHPPAHVCRKPRKAREPYPKTIH
jgi:hypothetical protein